jgi:MFS family permease
LYAAFGLFAVDLALMAAFPNRQLVLVGCVIASGIFIGINNTLMTQAVMIVSPVERPVASAAYGFVRFIGGGVAPFAAGKMVEQWNLHVPFALASITVLAAIGVLSTGHAALKNADAGLDENGKPIANAHDVSSDAADEFGGAGGAIDEFMHASK